MVHPALQGRDFEPLQDGSPAFMGLDGGAALFKAADHPFATAATALTAAAAGTDDEQDADDDEDSSAAGLVAFFINEAAYYETGVAFTVARREFREMEIAAAPPLLAAAAGGSGLDAGLSEVPRL
eukprot:SAG22_NODE_6483_length_848_cov_1.512684_2_plen_125_part_00